MSALVEAGETAGSCHAGIGHDSLCISMRSACRHTRSQCGSILFMILLAVVLFAALSYAVTNSIQGGSKDGSSESADAAAAEILQWFAAVDNAVMRMKLNGIAYEDMSFRHDSKLYSGIIIYGYSNNSRCTSDTCRVFRANGGGVSAPQFEKYGVDNATGASDSYVYRGYMYQPSLAQWPGAGTSLNDIVITIMYISPSVCMALNSRLGITSPIGSGGSLVIGGVTPAIWDSTTGWNMSAYTSQFTSQLTSNDTFASSISGSGSGQYCNIYHVVIKR